MEPGDRLKQLSQWQQYRPLTASELVEVAALLELVGDHRQAAKARRKYERTLAAASESSAVLAGPSVAQPPRMPEQQPAQLIAPPPPVYQQLPPANQAAPPARARGSCLSLPLIIFGVWIGAYCLLFFDTSVPTGYGDRVNNIGLMQERLIGIIAGGFMTLIGVVIRR